MEDQIDCRKQAFLGFILREMAQGRLQPLDESSWTERTTRLAYQHAAALLRDGSLANRDAVIDLINGTTIYFMLGAVHLPDALFEKALGAHLDTLRTALIAVIRPDS